MNRVLVSVALLGLVAGCSSQSVTVQRIDPGSECPAGGVRLFIDGKNPEVVCNGTDGTNGTVGTGGQPGGNGVDGVASLIAQSQLAPGDTRCPRGGAEVRSGLDSGGDGGDGGTANDGTLQAGEVTSSTVLCNGDDGVRLGSLIPPGGAVGTATIKANGADATAGRGGNGGLVRAAIESGTNGGHVKVWKTGHADATFTVPTPPAMDLGDVPLDITTDTTLLATTDATSVDAGVAFMDPNNQALFISQGGTAAAKLVSSLHVASGVTLTVPFVSGRVNLDRSCRVEGTVRGTTSGPQDPFSRIAFTCGDVVLSSTSRIDALGTAQTPTIDVELVANAGFVLALGSIDTSGIAGGVNQVASNGGSIRISGDKVFTSGVLRANAGSGAETTYGGNIDVAGTTGVFNQATIEANGGDVVSPAQGTAGNGGSILLEVTDSTGELRNRGAITTKGGRSSTASCATTACVGGTGGNIGLQTIHGGVSNDATLTATGGSGTSEGGRGGNITIGIAVYSGTTGVFGSVLVSGSLDVSGAAGGVAGTAGNVIVQVRQGADHGAEAILLGYSSIEANGGAGVGQGGFGGTGGELEFYQRPGSFSGTRTSAGAVMNTVELRARGGAGDALAGGNGGSVSLYTQTDYEWPAATWEILDTSGPISVNGGLGSTGGNGGSVYVQGRIAVTSSGSIEAKGGAGTTAAGGTGGSVGVFSQAGRVTASASIDASAGLAGGGPVQNPGVGGDITLRGVPVVNSGTLTAKGGAADIVTGTGGAGGYVLLSSVGGPTQNTVAAPAGIVVSGGTAQTPGAAGAVSIDGFLVTSQWTH